MDISNKKLLMVCFFLAGLLGVLMYVKTYYLGPDFKVKFKMASSSSEKIFTFTADTSLYHFSSHEGKLLASSHFFDPYFLPHFPMRIGNWVGEDYTHQYADISLFRLYRHESSGKILWLIIVYGGHESQFHSAEVCYIGEGWDVAKREIKRVKVENESFPIRYFIAQKDSDIHVVSYWYLWETSHRAISDGTLLFRISIVSPKSEEEGEGILKDFLNSLLNLEMETIDKRSVMTDAVRPFQRTKELKSPPVLYGTKEKTLRWLLDQRTPNKVVPFPLLDRRYLLLSYELHPDHPQTQNDKSYPYIFSRSAIYDNAIGLIALSMAGKISEAEGIMDALGRMIQKKGTLWFSYNTHDDWPSEGNHDEAIVRNGASAWAGYAMTFHLRRMMGEDPQVLHKKNYIHYLEVSEKIADAILRDQVLDPSEDPRQGAVMGGMGSHEMIWNAAQKKVVEVFKEGRIEWASIEHNLDVYFFLKNLVFLTKKTKYQVALGRVKEALLRSWNSKEGQFNRGLRRDGQDRAQALDCASWGLLFALSMGDRDKVNALAQAMERYSIQDPIHKIKGYRPYYKGLIYDEPAINKIFYPHKPTKSWSDIEMVWSEGSLGVAMAYLKMGKTEKARAIVKEILKMQTPSGGIRYATQEIPFQFSPSPSMAGTAWLAMVLYALEDPELLRLFWD